MCLLPDAPDGGLWPCAGAYVSLSAVSRSPGQVLLQLLLQRHEGLPRSPPGTQQRVEHLCRSVSVISTTLSEFNKTILTLAIYSMSCLFLIKLISDP